GGAGLTVTQVAARYGHKHEWASRQVGLLRLPSDWQKRVAAGDLSVRQGYSLSVHSSRPEVLGAVAADLERNAADWATAAALDKQLAIVVERFDALDAPAKASADAQESGAGLAALPRGMVDAQGPATLPLSRRSAPVDHELPRADDAVAEIVAMVEEL